MWEGLRLALFLCAAVAEPDVPDINGLNCDKG
jgi:hypothetical protein